MWITSSNSHHHSLIIFGVFLRFFSSCFLGVFFFFLVGVLFFIHWVGVICFCMFLFIAFTWINMFCYSFIILNIVSHRSKMLKLINIIWQTLLVTIFYSFMYVVIISKVWDWETNKCPWEETAVKARLCQNLARKSV